MRHHNAFWSASGSRGILEKRDVVVGDGRRRPVAVSMRNIAHQNPLCSVERLFAFIDRRNAVGDVLRGESELGLGVLNDEFQSGQMSRLTWRIGGNRDHSSIQATKKRA